MVLDPNAAVDRANDLLRMSSEQEETRLKRIHAYLTNEQELFWLPTGVPEEVRRLAKMSRVNMLDFVVRSMVQSMYLEGIRSPSETMDVPVWNIWQRNRMDARQIGIHRAAVTYGASYVTVLPGDPEPVIRGVSPRQMTVSYGDDDEWPRWALERRNGHYRLFDDEAVYLLEKNETSGDLELLDSSEHGAGVTPVVRFRETEDLDSSATGVVEPHMELQDQINLTTFGLLVAQHYGAFKQRYIIGWLAETEQQKVSASASRLWTFEDHPNDVQVGEFQETDLNGYLNSREATLRHLATVSQTPAHELLGQMVNLSAEALAAAEASQRRAITQTQMVMGESWEQVLGLAGQMVGIEPDPMAYVQWKDTEARSMSQMADALGKLAQQLGVPPQELWERIPGVSLQEVERWKSTAAEGDAMANLQAMLDRQSGEAESGANA